MTTAAPMPATTSEEMHGIFQAQREAFVQEGSPSAEVRRNRLDRLLVAVLSVADELAAAHNDDYGHRPELSNLSNVATAIGAIGHVREHLEEWMQPVVVEDAALPTVVDSQPLGVVGVIGPWNFPLSLVVQPAAEAIAAGNRVMIKYSDYAPRSGRIFAESVAKYFPSEELAVIEGGPELAAQFSDLPFNHMFFTGSPAVGRLVQTAAGKNLTPTTLELGGKNPVVIAPDADVAEGARAVAAARVGNGGQICLCPDYVFVPSEKVEAFVQEARDFYLENLSDYLNNEQVTTIINERNYDRVLGLIDDALAKGAQATLGVNEEEAQHLPDRATRRIPPTILTGVTDDMLVAQEEVFGSVLAVYPYDDISEVIDYVSRRPSPLAAYWIGEESEEFERFRKHTNSGGMTRNSVSALHFGASKDLPFGGVGMSGMGSYHGKAGFDTFTHKRVITASTVAPTATSRFTPSTPEAIDALKADIARALEAAEQRVAESGFSPRN